MTTLKLFFYYAFHSVKNQIKKLFKTWVIVFIAVCFVFGALIGIGGTVLSETIDGGDDTEITEDIPVDDVIVEDAVESVLQEPQRLVCAFASVITILMLSFSAIQADKDGCAIFTQPDVNILFASPMKPQSVLLFKLLCKMGASVAASIYLLFQLPNFVVNMGAPVFTVIGVVVAWMLLLIFTNLLQVFFFTWGSTNSKIKASIRPITYGILFLVAVGFVLYWRAGNAMPWDAAVAYFSADCIEYIPLFGWIVGLVKSAIYGDVLLFFVYVALLILSLVLLVRVVWYIKADFYEDAMAKSEQTAEILRNAQDGVATRRKDKKDRSEKLKRDGMKYGQGANIYFFKGLYTRFRFAYFKIFTKTAITYLVAATGAALIIKLGFASDTFFPVAFILGALAFFRSLGNPISRDIELNCFIMIPEAGYKKIFYSMLSGATDCILDLIPAMIVSTVLLGADPLQSLDWMIFIASVDFYASGVVTFIALSLPVALSKQIQQVIVIMFIYFGLSPNVIIILLGIIFDRMALFAMIGALFGFTLGVAFSYLSAVLLDCGRK